MQVTPGLGRLAMKLLGPNTLVQAAIPDIVSKVPAEYHQKNRELFHANARHILETLSKAPGLKPVMPKATMYFMVSPPLSMPCSMRVSPCNYCVRGFLPVITAGSD